MKDRVSKYPGRVLLTPEDGSAPFYATMQRADEPTQPGDPLNKNTFLRDETAALFGLDPTALPDDVFRWINEWMRANWKPLAEFDTAGAYTFAIPEDVDELGVFVLGGGGSGGAAVSTDSDTSRQAFGGCSGQLVQRILRRVNGDFTPGETASVVVGAGGTAVTSTGHTDGNAGGTSSFKEITADGGLGGISIRASGVTLPEFTFGGQVGDYPSDRVDGMPAPYGLVAASRENVSYKPQFYPYRSVPSGYGGQNIFDESDGHIYCGAGGFVYSNHAQPAIQRDKGAAGAGRYHSGSATSFTGYSATAPGDGGGAVSGSERDTATSGAGADGLVMVYGRKAI